MIRRRRGTAASLLGIGVLTVAAAVAAAPPVAADSGNTVRDGHARFEVLTPTLVRLEYADDDQFQDGTTINADNRDFPTPAYSTEVDDGWRVIKTSQLTLRYKENSGPFTPANTEMDLTVAGQPVAVHPTWTTQPCVFGQVCEAEDGQLSGGASVASDHTGYSGSGFVAGYQNVGAVGSYTVDGVPAAGDYTLAVREANYPASSADGGACQPRTLSVYVGGTDVGTITLPATPSWDDWTTVTTTVHLAANENSVALKRDPDDCGNVNVDYMSFSTAGQPLPQPQPAPATHSLGGWRRSLDGQSGPAPLAGGLLSRDGWYLLDDTQTALWTSDGWATPRPAHTGAYQDGYFFGYGHDYKQALQEFAQLTGPAPVLPEWAFGNWYSRYYPYTTADYENSLVPAFRQHQVPLDTLVIDTDWKNPSTWNGWNWNPDLFPDPQAFLDWTKQQGLHTTLNIHSSIESTDPQFAKANAIAGGLIPNGGTNYVWDWSNQKQAQSYFSLHQPFEQQGVNFWWLDWCCDNSRVSMPGLTPDTWINYLYSKDLTDKGERGFAFSRMGSSLQAGGYSGSSPYPSGAWAEHRYDVHFTGDTFATWDMLGFEAALTPDEGASIGLPYVTHDIGSFHGGHDPDDLYARWVQLGAFQPVLRLHSDHGDRLPWNYGPAAEASAEKFLRLREALVPYSYITAREAHDTGLPMTRALYLDYPDAAEAYQFNDEYMYGDEMLVAPISTPGTVASRRMWFPPGTWIDYFTGAQFQGPSVQTVAAPLDRMPVFVKAGAIIPTLPYEDHVGQQSNPATILSVYAGADGGYQLYSDAGDGLGYEKAQYAWTPITTHQNGEGQQVITIGGAQGSYPGQPVSRNFQLKVVDASRPATVHAGNTLLPQTTAGSTAVGWWYDDASRTVHVTLPPSATQDTTKVDLDGTRPVTVTAPPVVGVNVTASAMTSGSSSPVTATVTNYGPGAVSNVSAHLQVPAGWSTVPSGTVTIPSLTAGQSQQVTWQVDPASPSDPVAQQTVQASAGYSWPSGQDTATGQTTVYVTSPVQAPYHTFGATSPAYFGQQGTRFGIAADGTDVWTANDEYGAVYQPGAADSQATATVRVDSQDATDPWAKSGLMLRDDMTKPGSSAGYAMISVTPGNGIAFQWDSDGNGYLDGNVNTGGGTAAAPVWLKLARSGASVTASYSTDGQNWTTVGSATLPGVQPTEDIGMFATSHSPGNPGRVLFSGFAVTP